MSVQGHRYDSVCEKKSVLCSEHCRARHQSPATAQGILGVFLREPLLDWQREAHVLQGVRRSKGGARPQEAKAADAHISQKVRFLRTSQKFCLPS